jgi:Ca2+-binding EF-hand superfamily protein
MYEIDFPSIDFNMEDLYRKSFAKVDVDGNGRLSKKEFKQFQDECGKGFNCKYLFEIIDTDHSGTISLDEFLRFGRAIGDIVLDGDFKKWLKLIFDSCDRGKKEKLNPSEFRTFMEYVGKPLSFFDRTKTLKIFDADGSGTVDFDEIIAGLDLDSLEEKFVLKQ